MAIPKSTRKKKIRARNRTGISAAPLDKGYRAYQSYVHMEVDKKESSEVLKRYIKKHYNKQDASYALANPEWKFTAMSHHVASANWLLCDLDREALVLTGSKDTGRTWEDALIEYCNDLVTTGKTLYEEKQRAAQDQSNVITLTPQQKLYNKINRTIMSDLDDLEDSWMDGEKTELNVYHQFKRHGLAGSAVAPVRTVIEGWLLDYEDAYHKRCEQAVEGYSHLKRTEINRRIKCCQAMLDDLNKIKASAKATRTVRSKKPVAIDKQVQRLKYKKEDNDYKLTSINPAMLVGALCAFVFNTKYKTITKYVSDTGLMVSGSTLKNINLEQSIQNSLRKPNEFLPIVLTKSETQIGKAWSELTTKSRIPNGRINGDTIILRVLK